jgi:hypothetical protein
MGLRVSCVSVYAFAIENFKRSPEEVNDLMSLVKEKLLEISQHGYAPINFSGRPHTHAPPKRPPGPIRDPSRWYWENFPVTSGRP